MKRTGISILFWICNRKEERVIVYCRKMAVPDLQFKNNTRRIWFLPIVKFYRREEVQSCGRKVGHFINLFVSTRYTIDDFYSSTSRNSRYRRQLSIIVASRYFEILLFRILIFVYSYSRVMFSPPFLELEKYFILSRFRITPIEIDLSLDFLSNCFHDNSKIRVTDNSRQKYSIH